MTDHFTHLPLALIVASPTNPRKTFHAERLAELAENIKASGVHQPVIVRPLPGNRVDETAHMDPRPTFEIVSGERRLRASAMAGQATIPAIVRAMSDDQVLATQIIENLQRDDLTPLEEAEGYDTLMQRPVQDDRPALTADDVAAKIGKSRSYVYSRLKLLNLCTEGREALRAGKIDASVALLIARIPSSAIQTQALGNVFNPMTGEALSQRAASALIQRQYMLRLPEARFKITDAALVPSAGSCRECPKRTGADPDIFADVKGADVCTDPPCFHRKEQAHADAQLVKARETGATIITGREAKALMPTSWGDGRVEGFLRLDDAADSPTKGKPLRALIGKLLEKEGITPTLVANPHKEGELIAVIDHATAQRLLAKKGHQEQADLIEAKAQEGAKAAEAAELAKAQAKYEAAWRLRLMVNAWESITLDKGTFAIGEKVVRHIALQKAHALNTERAARLCKLLQLGKVAPCAAVVDWVKEHREPDRALALLVMNEDVEHEPWKKADDPTNVGLLLIAEQVRETPEDAQREVQEALKAAREAKKQATCTESQTGDLPLPSAAQAGGVRGGKAKKQGPAALAPKKPKTTAREALQGIAAAMQGEGGGGADAGPSGTDQDGASAVGEGGRATSPDAGAERGIAPGARVVLVSNVWPKQAGTVIEDVAVCTDEPPVWLVHMDRSDESTAYQPEELTLLTAQEGARIEFIGQHFPGKLGRLKGVCSFGAGKKIKNWSVYIDGFTSEFVFEPHEFRLVADEQEASHG